MEREVTAHMSEDYRWKDYERRMDRVERATEQVPLIARDVADIKQDVSEVRDEARSMKRAFYTVSLSIVSACIIFALTANAFFK